MHIEIDPDLCLGSQNCVHLAKTVFAIGDDGLAYVLDGAAEAPPALVEQAARECPVGAIKIDGIVPPDEP